MRLNIVSAVVCLLMRNRFGRAEEIEGKFFSSIRLNKNICTISLSPRSVLSLLTMRWFLLVAALLTTAAATTLTYSVQPNEEACFYVWVEEVGRKVSFYFAVRLLLTIR